MLKKFCVCFDFVSLHFMNHHLVEYINRNNIHAKTIACEQALHLVPVVQTLDSAIHWIKIYPVDKYQRNQLRYPVNRFLSGGQRYLTFEQPGPGGYREKQTRSRVLARLASLAQIEELARRLKTKATLDCTLPSKLTLASRTRFDYSLPLIRENHLSFGLRRKPLEATEKIPTLI